MSQFGDLDKLLDKVDSKFSLVNIVTKRARQLVNCAPPLTEGANPNKPVSTAFAEIEAGKISYTRGEPKKYR